ncbi:MAG TPA: hypothetical protein VGN83_08465 [Falsiroseomonas sp.]|jgi:cytochrome b561|nr:hypothetical protein [Falsiroseomonas sp.]
MTSDRDSAPAGLLPWASATANPALLASGFAASAATDPAAGSALLRLHLPLGLTALAVMLARVALGFREAHAVRRLAASAWWRSAAPARRSSAAARCRISGPSRPRIPHGIGARLLALLVVLHVAAALHHALTRPGYIATRLHQSIAPDSRFQLINVGEWESKHAFQAATARMRQELHATPPEGLRFTPGLYRVIRE